MDIVNQMLPNCGYKTSYVVGNTIPPFVVFLRGYHVKKYHIVVNSTIMTELVKITYYELSSWSKENLINVD
jgi:hypothetical protein